MVFALEASVRSRCSQIGATPKALPETLTISCRTRVLRSDLRSMPASFTIPRIMSHADLRCDGCGQLASSEHIARRLQRLEWSTRYRPVHIGTLLLGAVAPRNDCDFIYSPAGGWDGEANALFAAVGMTLAGKPAEAALAEFQRGGFFLTHLLECPSEDPAEGNAQQVLSSRLPAALARIRRSLKPKRLVPVSSALEEFLTVLNSAELNCAILLDQGKPFALDADTAGQPARRLREALTIQSGRSPEVSAR
jgi:hypothetical protein